MDQEQNQTSCISGTMFSFLFGVLIGGALGLLFAPVAGKETREVIANTYDDLKEKIKKLEEKLGKQEKKVTAYRPEEEKE
jgi:gas vesicle protein